MPETASAPTVPTISISINEEIDLFSITIDTSEKLSPNHLYSTNDPPIMVTTNKYGQISSIEVFNWKKLKDTKEIKLELKE